jgi:hypothetical protein
VTRTINLEKVRCPLITIRRAKNNGKSKPKLFVPSQM